MSETDADFVTILSSELIAEIVEAYFNKELYKVAVKIVDLRPTADGYAFSLAFQQQNKAEKVADVVAVREKYEEAERNGQIHKVNDLRMKDEKGRFVKRHDIKLFNKVKEFSDV